PGLGPPTPPDCPSATGRTWATLRANGHRPAGGDPDMESPSVNGNTTTGRRPSTAHSTGSNTRTEQDPHSSRDPGAAGCHLTPLGATPGRPCAPPHFL